MWAFRASLYCCIGILILSATNNNARAGTPVRPGTGNPSPRLPRTSASQLLQQNTTGFKLQYTTKNPNARGNLRSREQQLLNVFEVVVSTLEGKLQRIDNLDKAVEHLMRRVEQLDNRVADNIVKNDAVIAKLMALDTRLAYESTTQAQNKADAANIRTSTRYSTSSTSNNNQQNTMLNTRLLSLDQKVTDIDSKLEVLKNQIDSNFLPFDDITAEASEKKPVSMNVIEITKSMNAEVINYVSKGLGQIRTNTETIDKKLQFHINIVSENLGKMVRQISDIHEAIVDQQESLSHPYNASTTTTPRPMIKSSKIDILFKQMRPIMTVSEKMDEVWDVVVGTKSSVDDLVPKSDELLTNTQRQERAIGEIHQDLRTKTNQIIENLDMVERRLKKQEDDVAVLAQRPISQDLLMDPTIDRLVEYDPNRYSLVEEYTEPPINPFSSSSSSSAGNTTPSPQQQSQSATLTATPQPNINIIYSNQLGGSSASSSSASGASLPAPYAPTNSQFITASNQFPSNSNHNNNNNSSSSAKTVSRKGGVIFPSIKNKPSVVNTTFSPDLITLKDVKGFSCVDLLNAGMRQSGVYYLQIRGTTYWFLKVFCEQEIGDGGWTVIQRRDEFGEPRENFNRDWADYKNGFGDPAKEFWLGNENIYMLTNNEDYALRVELEDFEGNKRYAQYSHFKIHSEADYYKLEIDGYEGNAGDSLNDPWYGSNNSPFSTYNRDNDRSSLNCASMLKGGWWWKSCGRGLNGLYLHDPQDLTARQGIVWFRWRGWDYTLKKATMMIKPRGPLPMTTTATST